VRNAVRDAPVEPVEGGSCNAYDYACGDAVNNSDLDGTLCVAGKNPNGSCRGSRTVKKAARAAKCVAGELNPLSYGKGSSVGAGAIVGSGGVTAIRESGQFVKEAAAVGVIVSGSTVGTGAAVALIVVGGAIVAYGAYQIYESCKDA